MKLHTRLYLNFILLSFIIISFNQSLNAQSLNGIYSNGEVSLHLEEAQDVVNGVFIDADGSYYEAQFVSDTDGLIGMLGEFAAYIPWESETMLLYIMPLDQYQEPIVDEAVEIALEYISDLNGNSGYVDYTQLEWYPIKKFGSDFYPSYVLATSTWSQETFSNQEEINYHYYGDYNGYFGVNLQNFPVGSIVRVEIEGEPLAKTSSYTTTISYQGVTEIFPIMEYDYEALKNVAQAKPTNFKYRIYLNNELVEEKMETVWVRSVNDAVTRAKDHHNREHNNEFIFAAYVNENEPALDPILGQILDYGIVDSWAGYQKDENFVQKQVFALWYHFQKEGFQYSSITTQSGSDERSFGQVVRFVGDALKTKQANCIDGTVLFASFLHKIGINTSIVLVPGHAYLAYSLDEQGTKLQALETTMLGHVNLQNASFEQDMQNILDGLPTSTEQSFSSFSHAVKVATNEYIEKAIPGIQNNEPDYMQISIPKARKDRIRPIK